MEYDIIFITGEPYFDHPLCGTAILRKLLEKHGYKVGVIEMPQNDMGVKKLGKPKLFFAITSGSIDSMMRNYTPLKKLRLEDKNSAYVGKVPDRAVVVYSNWIRQHFKGSLMVLGGVEASLRRFVHYDYWDNDLRKPILFDSRADILAYGNAEKQILEMAERVKAGKTLENIQGTCVISKEVPSGFILMPSFDEVSKTKEKFCEMQNLFSNNKNLAQKIDNRYVLQFKSPKYTTEDLDEYYELPFKREHLGGFEFSMVTHRGCIGDCNFCSLRLLQGNRIISRSEESLLREMEKIAKMPHFKGNIDDFGGPSANMYGMDCDLCEEKSCLDCAKLDRSHKKLVDLLRRARKVPGVKKIFVRSGIRYDLATPEYIQELAQHHVSGQLKIAPEHVSKNVLKLMNKDKGDLKKFIQECKKTGCELAFYFMTAHPGSTMKEARELAEVVKKMKNAEAVQVFIPTPMTVSTCMYYTGMNPQTKEKIYVPYTYHEKKEQKRVLF